MDSDREARRAWFRREVLPHEAELRLYAERVARPGETEADDLVHDTLTKMFALPNWEEVDAPVAFAKRMLRNLALDAARRSKVVVFGAAPPEDHLLIPDDAPDAEATVIARDELRRLVEIIKELPPQCRRVFTLRNVYGLSPPQVAEQLALSVSTVEKHLQNGLRICADRLGRELRLGGRRTLGDRWGSRRDRDGSR